MRRPAFHGARINYTKPRLREYGRKSEREKEREREIKREKDSSLNYSFSLGYYYSFLPAPSSSVSSLVL